MACSKCGKMGHYARTCGTGRKPRQEEVRRAAGLCTSCGLRPPAPPNVKHAGKPPANCEECRVKIRDCQRRLRASRATQGPRSGEAA